MFATDETASLAEWIIDDTLFHIYNVSQYKKYKIKYFAIILMLTTVCMVKIYMS